MQARGIIKSINGYTYCKRQYERNTFGVSKGSSSINRMYKYGVEKLYRVIFFSRKTCIKTSTMNLNTFKISVLIIFLLLSLQSRLFLCKFIVDHVHIFQLAKINRESYFHIY